MTLIFGSSCRDIDVKIPAAHNIRARLFPARLVLASHLNFIPAIRCA
jgi:hypothetical protein